MTPQSDVSLAPLCTMGVGGAARWFVDARTESDVCSALAWADQRGVPVYVLGGGSNVVIADEGLAGLVLRVAVDGNDVVRVDETVECRVGSGEAWDAFVGSTVAANLAGVECLSGIPGQVGGTPVQNVGAYGQDVSATIRRVRAIDRRTRRPVVFSNADCRFSYRQSRFKTDDANRYIVTRVDFGLGPDGSATVTYADVVRFFEEANNASPTLADVRAAILAIRRRKGMVIEAGNPANRSCGSFFVNPVVSRDACMHVRAVTGGDVPQYTVDDERVKIPAAWLIERAGFPRGTTRGVVGISPFQAQAIVNHGGARAADVVALALDVKRAVLKAFGISLVPEPVFLGFVTSVAVSSLLEGVHVNASD